jgi:hypothetical protein
MGKKNKSGQNPKSKSKGPMPSKDGKGTNVPLNANHVGLALLVVAILYIVFFVNLNYFYDWDTLERSISLKEGGIGSKIDVIHFTIRLVPGLLSPLGLDPLTAYKVFTALLMLIFVIGTFKFTHMETNDSLLAALMGLFILFNFGYTFLLTAIEDNIWMYAFLIFFIIFLFKDRWELAALTLSIGILVHTQVMVYILMFFSYVLLRLDFIDLIKDPHTYLEKNGEQFSQISRKFAVALVFLLVPLVASYSWLVLARGFTVQGLISNFLISNFHSDPKFWYFASNRSLLDQMTLVYYGWVSTFVCRWPEFLQDMPSAIYFGAIFLLILAYATVMGFSRNIKALCAVPTFLILFVHDLFYESYSIERWDFLPFFMMFFVVVGYAAKPEPIKDNIRKLFLIIVIISAVFTFASFNAITGFHPYSVNVYADELSKIMDNNSVVIETLRPDTENAMYVTYENFGKIVYYQPGMDLNGTFATKKVYSSIGSYGVLSKTLPLNDELIWSNKYNDIFSIVRLQMSA